MSPERAEKLGPGEQIDGEKQFEADVAEIGRLANAMRDSMLSGSPMSDDASDLRSQLMMMAQPDMLNYAQLKHLVDAALDAAPGNNGIAQAITDAHIRATRAFTIVQDATAEVA